MDKELNSNGLNAIAGLSMNRGAALDLAIQAPGLYRAAGSYNGHVASGGQPRMARSRPVTERGQAQGRRGLRRRVGRRRRRRGQPAARLPEPLLVEGITLDCTQQFADAAMAAGVPITFVIRPEGAHTSRGTW